MRETQFAEALVTKPMLNTAAYWIDQQTGRPELQQERNKKHRKWLQATKNRKEQIMVCFVFF